MKIDKRIKYWNKKYTQYWKNKVSAANSNDGKVETTTSNKIYEDSIKLININKNDIVLEMGVGFGRSLPLLTKLTKNIFALDISESMIMEAKKVTNTNITFVTCPSEDTPFENDKFNKIICFASFDAMYQKQTLIEMNRISKYNANILISGKNDNYLESDGLALEAEIGARKKGHPNYFTDFKNLSKNIKKFGFEITDQKYFLKRGDFGTNDYTALMPEKFYEYLIVLKKIKALDNGTIKIDISCDKSKTFMKI